MVYQVKNLTQIKGGNKILRNINLIIPENQILAILGPSGSGKTTLLRILAGLDQQSSGEISYSTGDKQSGILVFQDYRLFPFLSVWQNIAFGLKMKHEKKETIKAKVIQMLLLMGIEDISDRYPKEISGGQQQRVALARALVLKPKLLLLDEPFTSLDESLRMEMLHLVKQMQRQLKLTVVFVTHYRTEAYLLSQQIAILINGRILQVASPYQLDQLPENLMVAKFLGNANFISGQLVGRQFKSQIYHGEVSRKQNAKDSLKEILYLPYSGILQTDPTLYPAFCGYISEKKWNGQNYLYTVDVVKTSLNFVLKQNFTVGEKLKFYFVRKPLVF